MKKLERSRSDRLAFGVCGGLARYFGIDSDLVRVAFLLAAAVGGIGWVVYVAAYLLVPEAPEPDVAPREGGARTGGLLLVALAVLVYLAGHGFGALFPWGWAHTWSLLLPLLFLACGFLLIWPRLREVAGLSPGARPSRSVSDRVLAGVAGGIGREAGVDPALVRLALVAATVVSWVTVPLYVLLVLVLPEEAPVPAPGEPSGAAAVPDGPNEPEGGDQGAAETGR